MDSSLKPKSTPKDFFLWLGAMVAFYISILSLLNLFFNYIDRAYPDPLAGYGDPYSSSTRFSIAALIVLFPLFLLLMRLIRKDIAALPEKRELWVRKWALGVTLFIAGATMAIDLVTLVNTYLSGDVTMRFILKVLMVFLVAGGGFLHFLADARGYWESNLSRARSVAMGAGVAVIATILAGFFVIGTPGMSRLIRFDDQKVNDLTGIQWQVLNYWQAKGKLPATLTDLNDSLSGFTEPKDPQSGAPYIYQAIGQYSFSLCADFNADYVSNASYGPSMAIPKPLSAPGPYFSKDSRPSTWEHTKGRGCFLRTIDPERYPPTKILGVRTK